MAQIAENIITFLQKSTVKWKTELTSCGETIGLVDIRLVSFSLPLLNFAVCVVPLTKILQNVKAGYSLGNVKINHLFFTDDLKVYGKNKAEIESLVSTVQLISQDIEYLRQFKLVMKSQLNGKNKIKAANTWTVSLMRYGAGTIKWN